ncbi:transglycosylase SLT domain-containing protein [Caenispirillum bisanense]|uniref:transglycosylase SLT domain-containing protein n=1 Tax=Caenispirillum bisanense TaxID=414052 RepID=UPI0031DE6D1C
MTAPAAAGKLGGAGGGVGVLGGGVTPAPAAAQAPAQALPAVIAEPPEDPEDLPPPDLPADAAPETLSLGEQCLAEADRQERALQIPAGLLRAIMLAESGRWDRTAGALRAWPWTLNIAGTGSYHASREEARATAAAALRSGIRQVDIGCMQVSMAWHASGFRTVTEALEPVSNVSYGAMYLRQLYDQHGDWAEAVRRYHSGDAVRGEGYLRRVMRLWRGEGEMPSAGGGRVVTADRRDSPHHKAAAALAGADAAAARTVYAAILERNRDDRTALAGLAIAWERLGQMPEALAAWRDYLGREPGSEQAARRLVQLSLALPAVEADAVLSDLVRVAPDNPPLLDALARRRLDGGDAETAAALFARAAALAPEDPALAYNAAVTLDRLDRPRAAIRAYETLLATHGRNPVAAATLPLDAARQRLAWLRTRVATP